MWAHGRPDGTIAALVSLGLLLLVTTVTTSASASPHASGLQGALPLGTAVGPQGTPSNAYSIGVGAGPSAETYDSGNGFVYVMNEGSKSVSVINGSKVAATLSLGAVPTGATCDPTNGLIYLVTPSTKNVTVVNGTSV